MTFLRWLWIKNRKGMVQCDLKTYKGLRLLTRKVLIPNLLDSSLDLSYYTWCSIWLNREFLGLGFWYRVGGQSIRHFKTLIVSYTSPIFIFFVTWFCVRTRIRYVTPVISEFVFEYIKVDTLGLFIMIYLRLDCFN